MKWKTNAESVISVKIEDALQSIPESHLFSDQYSFRSVFSFFVLCSSVAQVTPSKVPVLRHLILFIYDTFVQL